MLLERRPHFLLSPPLPARLECFALCIMLCALLFEDAFYFGLLRVIEAELAGHPLDPRTTAWRRSRRWWLSERKLRCQKHNRKRKHRMLHIFDLHRVAEWARTTLGCARCGRCQEMSYQSRAFTVLDVNIRNRGTLSAR